MIMELLDLQQFPAKQAALSSCEDQRHQQNHSCWGGSSSSQAGQESRGETARQKAEDQQKQQNDYFRGGRNGGQAYQESRSETAGHEGLVLFDYKKMLNAERMSFEDPWGKEKTSFEDPWSKRNETLCGGSGSSQAFQNSLCRTAQVFTEIRGLPITV